jgi:hypothetical protein
MVEDRFQVVAAGADRVGVDLMVVPTAHVCYREAW